VCVSVEGIRKCSDLWADKSSSMCENIDFSLDIIDKPCVYDESSSSKCRTKKCSDETNEIVIYFFL
jgi:hypothetical protein